MAITSNENRWSNDLPQRWETRLLKYKLRKITDGAHVSPDTSESAYPFVSTVNIENGTINFEGCLQTSAENFSMLSSQGCRPKVGDVLFSKDGTVGRTALISFDKDFVVASSLIILTPRQAEVFPAFLDFMLRSHFVLEQINSFVKGSALRRVSLLNIKKVIGVFPPVEEQIRIASYLDKTCAAIDKAIEAKQKQLEILDALRKSIIHKAVTRGLDDSVELKDSGIEWMPKKPKNWKTCRIKDALDFFNTQRVPLSADVRGVMIEKKYDYYGASGIIDKVDNYLFDGTYILIAEDGANLLMRNSPLAFLATGKFWVNNHAHILKPQFGNDQYFVYLLESLDYSLYVTGAAQPKLTKENLGKYKIIIPPRDEQNTISTFLENKTKELAGLTKNIVAQISTLEQYRKSLIHECVTGKRRITEDHAREQ